jgi:hypothetical protein
MKQRVIRGKRARLFIGGKEIKVVGEWTMTGYIPWFKVPYIWLMGMLGKLTFHTGK